MINWAKGLTKDQEVLLEKMLKEEEKIPVETYTFVSGSEEKVLTGRLLPKNKLVRERDSGYTYYIETEDGLVTLSAFHWSFKKEN